MDYDTPPRPLDLDGLVVPKYDADGVRVEGPEPVWLEERVPPGAVFDRDGFVTGQAARTRFRVRVIVDADGVATVRVGMWGAD